MVDGGWTNLQGNYPDCCRNVGCLILKVVHPPSTIHDKKKYLYPMSEYSMADAIKQFLNKSRLKGDVLALQITEIWEKIMGKTIARYTDLIEIHGHTLYIHTTVAPLKQELLYKKDLIIERVNEALGEKLIREVVIR